MRQSNNFQMKSATEAREIIFSHFDFNAVLPPEEISTCAARGRVTAAPVWARQSSPASHQAAMDGFAVLAASTFWATSEQPKTLAVGEKAFPVNAGHTMPPGTNAVIASGNGANPAAGRITVEAPLFPWHNVRRIGDDFMAGELVLPQGVEITPLAQGTLLAAGCTEVAVRRLPKVSIISTGSESPDRLAECNSVILAGLVAEAGGLPEIEAIVPDNVTSLTAALKKALATADMVIINTGSPAGTGDYTFQAVSKWGEVLVHGVLMMPGKPTVLGRVNGKPVIGIPGYPISAVSSFEQFAAPLIAGLAGKRLEPRPTVQVHLAQNLPSRPDLTEFIRVTLGRVGDKVIANPLPRGAETITSLVQADALIAVPASSGGLKEDQPVAAELLVSPADLDGTLVFLGSHDKTIDLLASFLKLRDPRLRLSSGNIGSQGGLVALRQKKAHFGGSHLFDPETNTFNVRSIKCYLRNLSLKLINLAWREQGLMVAEGNPKNIQTIRDLTRPDIRFINRQPEASARLLFDYLLKKNEIEASLVPGYEREAATHMAAALNVHSGTADVGFGIFSAAKALGLDFIPLTSERYDLVVPESTFNDPRFQNLLEVIHSQEYQKAVTALGGYDLKDCGKIFWEQ